MSIAILCGSNQQEYENHKWFSDAVKTQLLTLDPQLDIQSWPKITDPEKVTCALVWRYPSGELKKFPQLKGIFSLGAGVDHIMEDKDLPKQLPVTRIVDPTMARDMTQHAVAIILNYIRRLPHWRALQQQQLWIKKPPFHFADKTLGIMGLGFLGSHVAAAATALQINTIGWSRTPKTVENIRCYSGEKQSNEFLQATDILICLLPHTAATENILNKTLFHLLKDDAYVINMARGPLLVDEDLIAALDTGKLSGACLDVFRQEPLAANHPFWTHPKITITPHIAAVTNPATIATQILENYQRLLKGEPLLNTVDIQHGY